MSIKDLWQKQKENKLSVKTINSQNSQEFFNEVESPDYVTQYQKSINLYLQDVNFATASNFARFGSARKYYENLTTRITETYTGKDVYYPYDGSKAKQLEFENNLNPYEKYIFLYEYPRSTGYVEFGRTWDAVGSGVSGFGATNTPEYIKFFNQNNDNIYDPDNGLRENTRFIPESGSTIEFWMKKNAFPNSATQTAKECIFYTKTYDSDKLLIIYIDQAVNTGSFVINYKYSNLGTSDLIYVSSSLSTLADSNWHHHAFVFSTSSGKTSIDYYLDGVYRNTNSTSTTSLTYSLTGSCLNAIGALGGKITSAGSDLIGYGKLSGSIDEFRFWNTKRNAKQIGLNYFTTIGGGNNVINNSSIGIYYKFNEGIYGDSSVDSVILDYAGGNCNGQFVGYNSNSRNTGSAITSTQDNPELGTPILRYGDPLVQTFLTEKLYYADEHDFTNNFMLKNSIPSWILDQDNDNGGTLVNFLQTIASYLDTLYLQIKTQKDLKNKDYLNYEGKAPPFSDLLLTSAGFDLPSLFLNTDIVQSLLNQDSKKTYNESINDLKNIIYKNIYNNLELLYKSKGTENSIKQLIKNFGVNQDIFSLNIYSNNTQYELENNFVNKSIKKDYIDFTPFSSSINSTAVVYQINTESGTSPFITGTLNNQLSFTAECDVVIPSFPKNYDYLQYKTLTWNTSSVFGIRTAGPGTVGLGGITYDTIVPSGDPAGLKVRFIYRDNKGYFSLNYPSASVTLTSSIFEDITTDQHWNLSVRLKPVYTGSSYVLEFAGYSNFVSDNFRSFSVSSSLPSTSGSLLLSTSKRLYVGAERDDVTGSLVYKSLIKGLSAKYWADYLTAEELKEHAKNPNNYGRLQPYEPYTLATSSYIPKSETLLLHWDFTNVTSSNSNGNINLIYDLTSGNTFGNSYANTPLEYLVGRRYDGKGYGFNPSSTIKNYELVYSSEQQSPENVYSNQLVNILATDDDYYTTAIRPQKYFFSLENSMYDVISKNMLNMFASIVEFNNFIGEPGNLYKAQYSKLKFFRKIFFDKASNTPDLDKYVGIYKWLDDALDSILFNLIPASANANDKIRTMVENHVLERSKIQLHLLPDEGTNIVGGNTPNPGNANAVLPPPGSSINITPLPPIFLPEIPIPGKQPKKRGYAQPKNKKIDYVDVSGLIPAEGSFITLYEIPSSFISYLSFNKRTREQKKTISARIGRGR
jgi:hypothetical protein